MKINGTYFSNLHGVRISGVSTTFPEKKVHNYFIHELLYGKNWSDIFAEKNYDADYIKNVLGYEERYWAHVPGTPIVKNEITSADLMVSASEKVLKENNLAASDIEMLIAVTVTSPKYTNSMGAFVAGKLGLQCPAIEVKTGCASGLYALVMAAQFIRSGAKHVLITAGETPTKVTGINGNLIYAVGDAGAAVIMSKDDNAAGISTAFLGTEGAYSGAMGSPGLLPPNQEDLDALAYHMVMGKESETFIQEAWQQIPSLLYTHSGMNSNDIDLLVPHQVNNKNLSLVKNAAGKNTNQTIDVINQYANCGSVGVLIALHEAFKQKTNNQSKKIMMAAVGGGVSYGGLIVNL